MNELFNMGGYAFYVWTSIGIFFLALIIDYISLGVKDKTVKRNIRSLVHRKSNSSKK